MDGFMATQKLRQQGMEKPIIALTANAMKGFEQECLDAGYSGYLSKPIDVDRFMEKMAELLDGKLIHKDESPLAVSVGNQEVAAEETQASESAPIVSTLPGNDEEFQELIALFVPRMHEQLEAMEQASANGDFGEVAAIAHWLAGAGGTVGFDVFTEPARKLEAFAKEERRMEVAQSIVDLRALAARLVVPGDKSPISTSAGEDPSGDKLLADKVLALETDSIEDVL